jgi:Tol biopolymer transport system component
MLFNKIARIFPIFVALIAVNHIYTTSAQGQVIGKIAFEADTLTTSGVAGGGTKESRIYLIKPDGSDKKRLTANDDLIAETSPSFSPDGSQIVFSGQSSNFKYAAYTLTVDGLSQQIVPIGENILPFQSPNGRLISYVALDGYNFLSLSVYNLDTKTSSVVSDYSKPGRVLPITWFPDSQQLLVGTRTRDKGFALSQAKLDGSKPVPVKLENVYAIRWSPDGKQIAVCLERNKIALVQSLTDSPVTLVTLEGQQMCDNWTTIAWSPDGTHLAYNTDFNDAAGKLVKSRIEVLDLQSKQVTTVIETADGGELINGLDWGNSDVLATQTP